MTPKFPCSVYYKAVAKNHNAVCCDSCNLWVHIKCNNLTTFCYRKLQTSQEPWYCKSCIKQILLFSKLSESQLSRITKENLISSPKKLIRDNNLVFLNDQYGTAIKNDSFTPDEFYKNLKTISPTYNLYLHMNISSLQYHIDDLRYLVESCPSKPKIIGITECRLRKKGSLIKH